MEEDNCNEEWCYVAPLSSDDSYDQEAQQIKENRASFDLDVAGLLASDSPSGRSLLAFIRRTLISFHLERRCTEAYVFNEAYIRGCKCIVTGGQIRNVPAFLRQVSYNVVREQSRSQKKESPLDESFVESHQDYANSDLLKDDLTMLRFAIQMLDPFDAKLLHLKIGEDLSWREIRLRLISDGDKDYSESVLRKRKERALCRLRKKYHAINAEVDHPEF
jgi:DNA-directed RNA polymerase specialized sigma24 family protein